MPPREALKQANQAITRILDEDRAFVSAHPARQEAGSSAQDISAVQFWAYAHPLVTRAMTRPIPNTPQTEGKPGVAFMAAHPEVRLSYQFIGEWNVAIQKLTVSLAAGDLPDVALVKRGWLARLASSGLVASVDDLAPNVVEDLVPAAKASVTYQGKVYALPADGFCSVLLYNPELVPQPPKTWDELATWAKATPTLKDKTGADVSLIGHLPYLESLWSADGSVCDEQAGHLDSAEADATLEFLLGLRNAGCVYSNALFDEGLGLNAFTVGRCAATVASSEQWARLVQQKTPVALAAVPGKHGAVSALSDNVLVVFAHHAQAKRDAIAALLDYLTGFETLGSAAVEKGSAPIRTSVAKALENSETARNLAAILAVAKAPPLLPSWNAIEFELNRHLDLAARWQPAPQS